MADFPDTALDAFATLVDGDLAPASWANLVQQVLAAAEIKVGIQTQLRRRKWYYGLLDDAGYEGYPVLKSFAISTLAARDSIYCPSNDVVYIGNIDTGVRIIHTVRMADFAVTAVSIEPRYRLYGQCYCPSNDRIYWCSAAAGDDFIAVMNPVTNGLVANIATGGSNLPNFAAYVPSTDRIWVSSFYDHCIYIINPSTNTIVATINRPADDIFPYGLCYCPTNDTVYGGGSWTDYPNNYLAAYRASDGAILAEINLGAFNRLLPAYCPTNDRIYVSAAAGTANNAVKVINPATNTLVTTITLSLATGNTIYCPANDRIVVGSNGGGTEILNMIRPATNAVTKVVASIRFSNGPCYCPSREVILSPRDDGNVDIYYVPPVALAKP
jgi:DNA-binding beta-propeller fold protein YncE